MDRGKEHKTPEEKKAIETEAIEFFKWFIKNLQGNITFPVYEQIVGKAKIEAFVDPMKAREIFKMGG